MKISQSLHPPTKRSIIFFFELFFDISPFEKKSLLLYHIIQGSIVPPADALCTSKLPVSFGGKNGEGSLPKIRCFDDIVGRKTSSVVGPLNKAKLDNISQLSRGGEVVSEEYCNGIVYKVSNVILPKFVEDIFDITCGTIQKENSVVNFFTKNEEFTIVAGGVYNLLASPPKLLVGRAFYSASKRCTGDAEYFCYEKCKNEIPDCTAVEVVDFFKEEFFGDGDAEYLCQFYNGQVKNAPIFKDDLSSVRRGKLTNIYFQSDVLGPQLFVPSNITNFDPEFLKFPEIDGTQDFLDFVGPAFLCVAISGKDPILCDQCIKDNTNPLRQSCTDLVKFFCTDSGLADPINGKCQEECFSGNTCLAAVQTASLATIGQTVFDSPEGNFDEGGCLTRDVFDPQIDAVVAPYTCPEQATS